MFSTNYSLKQGEKKFSDKLNNKSHKEINKIHQREMFKTIRI